MGAQNVTKVFAYWRHLNHREARALAFMANMALDADKPPKYFAGWEAVAAAIGLSDAASGRRMTMKVFATLRAAGATVSSGQARMNVRAEYALALDPEFTYEPQGSGRDVVWVEVPRKDARVSLEDTHQGVPKRHPVGPVEDTHQGVPGVHNRVSLEDTPRRTEEPLGGALEEQRGGEPLTNQSSLTTGFVNQPEALTEKPSIESERTRQLSELNKLIAKQEREAS